MIQLRGSVIFLDGFLDDSRRILHNRAVNSVYLRRIALAWLACWALGPAIGLGIALHELEHHLWEAEHHAPHGMTAAEVSQVLVHGHFHEDDPGDHSHSVVPVSITASTGPSQTRNAAAVSATGIGAATCVAQRAWRPGPSSDSFSLDPPSPFHFCVLRL